VCGVVRALNVSSDFHCVQSVEVVEVDFEILRQVRGVFLGETLESVDTDTRMLRSQKNTNTNTTYNNETRYPLNFKSRV
jgi:hypothetical protein